MAGGSNNVAMTNKNIHSFIFCLQLFFIFLNPVYVLLAQILCPDFFHHIMDRIYMQLKFCVPIVVIERPFTDGLQQKVSLRFIPS